jgi:hypothetical protein
MTFVKKLFRKIFGLKGNGSREQENGRKIHNGRCGNSYSSPSIISDFLGGWRDSTPR